MQTTAAVYSYVTTKRKSDEWFGYGDGAEFAMDIILTSDGKEIASKVNLSEQDILGRGPYSIDRRADSVSEGAPTEYRYHDSVCCPYLASSWCTSILPLLGYCHSAQVPT